MSFIKSLSVLAAAFLFVSFLPSSALCAGEKIAVLPWKVNASGDVDYIRAAMPDMLSTRLGQGRSDIIRPEQAGKAVAEKKGELNDAGAFEAGKTLKADYVLYGSLTIFGNAVSMDARLININTGEAAPFASKGTGIESIIGLVDKLSSDVNSHLNPPPAQALPGVSVPVAVVPAGVPAAAAPGKDSGFIIKADKSREQPVLWKGRDIDGMFVAMTAADLDKDGVKELFLISGNVIAVAKYSAEGMEVIKEITDSRTQNIAVTSIDSDNDGAIEVYVSRISGGKPASAMLEYRGGVYSITASNLDWMLRAVSVDGKEPVLAGQRLRTIDGFFGDLKKLRKDGDGLKEVSAFEVELPRNVNIFGFETFNMTGGAAELATLDSRQYLTLYSPKNEGRGWAQSYKSSDYYGGTLNLLKLREAGGGPESAPISIEGRFFYADMDKDGKKELIIKKNTPGGLGRSADVPASFKTGEIISLSWDAVGGTTAENWRTKQVEGYISDFFIDDLDGDGNREVTMLVVTGTEKLFGTLKSYILSHRISL
jgi:TolB-like protein